MKTIPLTQGYSAIVDDDDYESLSKHSWITVFDGKQRYAKTRINGIDIKMHRMILNPSSDKYVDHMNENGLDNRRSNIRVCSPSENMMNRGSPKNNTSGYKGVTFSKKSGKWQSQIASHGKRYFLGYYETPELAYEVYLNECKRLHGNFYHA